MSEQAEYKKSSYSSSATLAVWATAIFFLACIFGEGVGGSWGNNASCYEYIGCTAGFIGYDAIEHFLFGVAAIFVLLWLFKRFPKYSMLEEKRWKNILVLIALVALASVVWEFLECAHDFFRIDILHQPLSDIKLHINLLDQPTNLDTMGDLAFGLSGSLVALLFRRE